MPEKYNFLDPKKEVRFTREAFPFVPDVAFVMECPSLDRIGFVAELIPRTAITVNIDHHLGNDNYANINYVDVSSCAAGEIVYAILKYGGYKITQEIAENLYCAIISDTGNFRFASTTARGMEVAAELVEYGARPKVISDFDIFQILARNHPSFGADIRFASHDRRRSDWLYGNHAG